LSGTWRFFRPAMHERAKELAALDRDLRRALERDEFVLHYQPMVGAERLGLHALEALLRWNHPERGLVAPGEFLPAAERGRLIVPLTFWVLAEAVRQAAAWRAEGLGDVCVAANLATAALDADGLVEHVTEQLRAEGLPAGALTVEVTEGAVAGDSKMVVVLEALRRTGVRVAIDDFGAGYSSLARLRDLPLDLLKIDRAFLAAPGVRGDALLHAITGLAQSLELPTVVEGVETVEQLGLLRRAGASYAQGFLLARPMPAARVPAWLATWNEGRPHEPRTYGGEQRTGLTPGSLRDRPREQPNERRADAGAGSTTRSDGGPGLRGPTVSASGSRLTDGTHLRRLARSRSGHGG
jgi:EAL domain-containing protein (putative c-di-GMP-specific phosphodiesterase class I)